jgi:hypothetical protein
MARGNRRPLRFGDPFEVREEGVLAAREGAFEKVGVFAGQSFHRAIVAAVAGPPNPPLAGTPVRSSGA